MDTRLALVLMFSICLLTTACAAPAPYDPNPIGPGFQIKFCSCITGETASCTDSNGCEGSKVCKSSSTCTATATCDDSGACQDTKDTCETLCSISKSMCEATPCGGMFGPCPDCETPYDECISGCADDYNDCAACTGYWGACAKDVACCGVDCAANEECDAGACQCADTDERCGADGTGDGVDNDCDGSTDEGCDECSPGAMQQCTEDGCLGDQTCKSNGNWGNCEKDDPCCGVECSPNRVCNGGNCVCADVNELCVALGVGDGIDNDCDGNVDEGCEIPGGEPGDPGSDGSLPGGVACPADAMLCPDGSSVGRVPPLCQFAPCPSGGSSGITPGGNTGTLPGTSAQGSSIDMNMVFLLLIVIIIVIGLLVALKLVLGRKKQSPAQPMQPMSGQPQIVYMQPPR